VLETRLVATPWGLPLWLFLAALSCRLRGRPVVLLNVGAERPTHPVTRWLYRSTVRLATHCTYRDDASRAAASAMGATGRPGEVHPDLAFLLPVPETGPQRSGHVVLGVMTYEGRPDDPRRGPATVGRYRDRMVELGTRLLDDGHSLTIVVGDLADRDLAEAIAAGVRAARPGLRAARVAVSDATDVDGVMRETAAAEVVLASRFHTVICAVKTATPTVLPRLRGQERPPAGRVRAGPVQPAPRGGRRRPRGRPARRGALRVPGRGGPHEGDPPPVRGGAPRRARVAPR
jgi:polysaccharide pyruvyl transferase WcaK-like protein